MPADTMQTLILVLLIGVGFYFLAIRPQRKRAKEMQEMTKSLEPGSRVMISAGIVGSIKHLGERQAILEIAPGVEMTIFKQAIVKVLDPHEDEFEYADDEVGADAEGVSRDPRPDAPEEFIDEPPTAPQK